MPIFTYKCNKCIKESKLLLKTPLEDLTKCDSCQDGVLERILVPPTSQTLEVLDNGYMPKKLERLYQAEEIYKDHAKKYDK